MLTSALNMSMSKPIPRPSNAFMLFRSHFSKHCAPPSAGQPQISALAGQAWRNLDAADKAVWHARAAETKAKHAETYPGYRYDPRRRRSSKAKISPLNGPSMSAPVSAPAQDSVTEDKEWEVFWDDMNAAFDDMLETARGGSSQCARPGPEGTDRAHSGHYPSRLPTERHRHAPY
ncbi:unnamed protein product [Mycena citricolor]|uniref:HMG box domain-containing protein n=1 Tax=Mycena citricolor TaxID=2018698 RepID=A0AAD2K136_9AGAR|nr:unnamed protein product [Mycena citricolor]